MPLERRELKRLQTLCLRLPLADKQPCDHSPIFALRRRVSPYSLLSLPSLPHSFPPFSPSDNYRSDIEMSNGDPSRQSGWRGLASRARRRVVDRFDEVFEDRYEGPTRDRFGNRLPGEVRANLFPNVCCAGQRRNRIFLFSSSSVSNRTDDGEHCAAPPPIANLVRNLRRHS